MAENKHLYISLPTIEWNVNNLLLYASVFQQSNGTLTICYFMHLLTICYFTIFDTRNASYIQRTTKTSPPHLPVAECLPETKNLMRNLTEIFRFYEIIYFGKPTETLSTVF